VKKMEIKFNLNLGDFWFFAWPIYGPMWAIKKILDNLDSAMEFICYVGFIGGICSLVVFWLPFVLLGMWWGMIIEWIVVSLLIGSAYWLKERDLI
jgi:hypothetical protein